MTSSVECIRALVENSGTDPRRAVQMAMVMAAEQDSEEEVLRAVESGSTVAASWLRAGLVEKISGTEAAKPLWAQVVARNGCEIPDVLLHRARILARGGETSAAAALLRVALQNSHEYDFFVRAEVVARKCRAGFPQKRKVKVALLASSTTSLLRSVLELQLLRDGLAAEIYEPPFGNYAQELLATDSQLKAFHPDFILLLLNWRDLGLSGIAMDDTECNQAIARISDLWRAAAKLQAGKIIQPTFSPPICDAMHALSSRMAHGKSRTIRKINEALYQAAEDRVLLIDSEGIAAMFHGSWEDSVLWSSAKVYPAPAILPTLGEHIVSLMRAEMGMSQKLLVLDLDNTLWGGVIGEDGMNGITLGPPSALGERYRDFQQYLMNLKERGVLLALASKNNAAEVARVLHDHPYSVLRQEDFVASKVNWENKADNIRKIASELRLGLESFVFLDDNPVERSSVRRELPEVIVPEISGEPAESIAALDRGLYFQTIRLTDEDRARNASYVATARQNEISNLGGDLEEFLAELSMQIEYGPVDEQTSVRVAQLINKTNQFNLTTPRYSLEEVQARMTSSAYWCHWYRLKDRFADHGVIGVLIAQVAETQWSVDTWLLSCRVIGREVELFMLRDLIQCARAAGAECVIARYIATAKNGLVANLLPKLGFAEAAGHGTFTLNVAAANLPQPKFFREVKVA